MPRRRRSPSGWMQLRVEAAARRRPAVLEIVAARRHARRRVRDELAHERDDQRRRARATSAGRRCGSRACRTAGAGGRPTRCACSPPSRRARRAARPTPPRPRSESNAGGAPPRGSSARIARAVREHPGRPPVDERRVRREREHDGQPAEHRLEPLLAALRALDADVHVQAVHALPPRRVADALDHLEVALLLHDGQRRRARAVGCAPAAAIARPLRARDPVGRRAQLAQRRDRLVDVGADARRRARRPTRAAPSSACPAGRAPPRRDEHVDRADRLRASRRRGSSPLPRRRARAAPTRRSALRSRLAADAVHGPAGGLPRVVRRARAEARLVRDDARVAADLLRALRRGAAGSGRRAPARRARGARRS